MGETAASTPVPLPLISSDIWNLISPLLPHVETEQRETINNQLQHLALQELSRIICAASYLNIPIAHRLVTAECKTEFLQNNAFLCSAGLCCTSHSTHDENIEHLPNELSRLIAQKMWEECPTIRAHLLQNAPVNCKTLQVHTNWFKSVYVVAGDRIVSGSEDNTIRIWDINTGQCIHTLQGHTHWILSACVAGDRIVSGSRDRTIRIWDINTGQCLHTLQGHTSWIKSVCVADDRIVSGSFDNTIRIWDINTGECLHTLQGHTSWIKSVCVADDRIVSELFPDLLTTQYEFGILIPANAFILFTGILIGFSQYV